ncbi:MAG: choice-of-anchor Q domain-containing protein [Rhodoglobus sp.]
MYTAPSPATGAAFVRKRGVRVASGFASAGMLVGISLVAASPAAAATDADCIGVTVSSGVGADIQTLIDGVEPVICLSGTFVLTTTLLYDRNLTIHGLTDAVLDGNNTVRILQDEGDNTLTVENLQLTQGYVDGEGGAIYGSEVIVHNSQFDNNNAILGGAIRAYTVDAYDSLFFDNDAGFLGGAILAEFASVTRTTLTTNTASDAGGAILAYGVVYSDSSTFDGNTAGGAGGAILGANGVDVRNSTFVENSSTSDSGYGGAIFTDGGLVTQSTFLDNSAANGQSLGANNSSVDLRGNIFAGSGPEAQLATNGGTIVDLGANLFTTTQGTESDLTSVQPTSRFGLTTAGLFNGATLASNGGPTQTVALHAGSPALSAVPASPDSMTVDQRGVARPAVSDAGAYEFANTALLAATGSTPAGWVAGAAALLLAAGAAVLGVTRRTRRAV